MVQLVFDDKDFFNAALNWMRWKDNYECSDAKSLPVLLDKEMFKKFCAEYSVLRYEEPKHKEALRSGLLNSISTMISGPETVESLAADWKETYKLKKSHVSFATKIFAFRDPVRFFPMDRFSKLGLQKVDKLGPIEDYRSYLVRFAAVRDNNSTAARQLIDKFGNWSVVNLFAFENRLMDCALMRLGGR